MESYLEESLPNISLISYIIRYLAVTRVVDPGKATHLFPSPRVETLAPNNVRVTPNLNQKNNASLVCYVRLVLTKKHPKKTINT